MNKYLPSKKFIKFMGIILAITLVVWVVSMVFSKKQIFERESNNSKITAISDSDSGDFYQKDSDGDGVFDWEEGLWGTNPNKEDTDGDGVPDGVQIANQKKEIQDKNNLSEENKVDDSSNQTATLAKQFLSTASLIQQQGGLSNQSLKSISNSFGSAFSNTNIPDLFTVKDLKLNSVDVGAYKQSMTKAFEPILSSSAQELEIIYEISNDKVGQDKSKQLAKLDELVKEYKTLSSNVLKVEAPYTAAGIQLKIINDSAKISIGLGSIEDLNKDPLSAMIGFQQYQKYSNDLQKTLIDLRDYFTNNGIM